MLPPGWTIPDRDFHVLGDDLGSSTVFPELLVDLRSERASENSELKVRRDREKERGLRNRQKLKPVSRD